MALGDSVAEIWLQKFFGAFQSVLCDKRDRLTEILKWLIRWNRWPGIALMRFSQLEREQVGRLTESVRRDCEKRRLNRVVMN